MIESPCFPGTVCIGTLDQDLRIRAEFVSTWTTKEYNALLVTVLNRTEGVIDRITLKFVDILGKKKIPNEPAFRDGVIPQIWDVYGDVHWYAYDPTDDDYKIIWQNVAKYLDVFRYRRQDHPRNSLDSRPLIKQTLVTLPVEGDPEFLSELYFGNYEPGIFKSTPEGDKLIQKLNDAYDALAETLPKESRDRLDHYLEIAAERSATDARLAYESGFRTAVQMIVAGLSRSDSRKEAA